MDLAVAFCGATASDVVRRVEGSTRSDSLRGEDGGDGDDTTMETEGQREGHETQRAEGRRHQLPPVRTQASGPSARGSTREQITPSAPWAILDRGEGSKRGANFSSHLCLPTSILPKQRQAGPPGKQQQGLTD